MIDNNKLLDTINDLIENSKDDEEGFIDSAEKVTDQRLKDFFLLRSKQVAERVRDLQGLVESFDGIPATTTLLSGTLHRKWIDLKSALSLNDNLAVINQTELDEQLTLSAYDEALSLEIPPDAEILLSRQFEILKQNHQRLVELRAIFAQEAAAH
jgi:uncharacterized protein (TIGR02284 family)